MGQCADIRTLVQSGHQGHHMYRARTQPHVSIVRVARRGKVATEHSHPYTHLGTAKRVPRILENKSASRL